MKHNNRINTVSDLMGTPSTEIAPQNSSHLNPFSHRLQFGLDAASWIIGLIVGVFFRYEFDGSQMSLPPLLAVCVALVIAQLLVGWLFWLYRGRYTSASFEEAAALLVTVISVAMLVGIPVVFLGESFGIPRSATLMALPLAFLLMGSSRYLRRLNSDRLLKPQTDAKRTLIYRRGSHGPVVDQEYVCRRLFRLPACRINRRRSFEAKP
ncbi:hypothetical protein ACTAQJ_22170 [Arthrobacter sp. alpha11c]